MSMEKLVKRSRQADRWLRREAKRRPTTSLARAFHEIEELRVHLPGAPAGGPMGSGKIEAVCGTLVAVGANQLDCREDQVTCPRCLDALRRRRSA